ncbi:liver-enriched gene 1, tandem duplicate 1 [Colossoma macropomum]|uniref:liver-enriched gene 1, tandem duplicate 1 n=1 Tax=Colossoma macropomum TaxID=42526 RepID=UPI001864C356|nr:liver-enriched gene 1, tandem duplicate 1 [Colossoma macropomum]
MHFTGFVAVAVLLVTICRAAVVTENGFPILWEKAPALLSELPQADGVVKLDPWDYLQRMAMYRLMINATNSFMSSMGPGATENPLWGLPLQLGWKLKSGRLVDPTGVSTCGQESSDPVCIATSSWWGCANYHLSVIPFLVAVEAGLVGDGQAQVKIQVPAEMASDYCSSTCSSVHPDAIQKWATFFQSLKTISASEASDDDKRDQILGLMWSAQLASLDAVSSTCADKKTHYSSPERSFIDSWLHSAQYVGASHFHSSMEKSVQFMTPLPSRVLQETDKPPKIADLSTEENHTLYIFSWMTSINKLLGGTLTSMWQRAMCSAAARVKGRALLDDLLFNPQFATSSMLSILTEMTTKC